jgi:hypothetical protein
MQNYYLDKTEQAAAPQNKTGIGGCGAYHVDMFSCCWAPALALIVVAGFHEKSSRQTLWERDVTYFTLENGIWCRTPT